MAPYPGLDIISLERFRASLALLLPASDIDAATRHLDRDPDPASPEFLSAIRSIQLRLIRQRAVRFLSRFRAHGPTSDEPHGRLRDEATDRGLAYVLHVGLGMPTTQVAHLLDTRHYDVSRGLLDIRLRMAGRGEHQCKIFLDTLGRYRDGYFDLGVAASIVRHRGRCATCHELLRDFESLDNSVLGEVEAIARGRASAAPAEPAWIQRLTSVAPVAAIAVALVVALVLAGGFVDRFTGGSGTPLLASPGVAGNNGERGWILLGTSGGDLQAFDPHSGRRHTLLSAPNGTAVHNNANYLISPSEEKVAIFSQNPVPGLHWATRRIDVVSITGEPLHQIEFSESDETGWPTGWLNDDEILLITVPAYEGGEPPERFLSRLEDGGRLRALDVTTGDQRLLYEGAVAQVIASPDGSRLAMVRPHDPREVATTLDIWEVDNGDIGEHLTSIEHRFTWHGGLLWSPTSDALYIGYVAEFEDGDDDTTPARDGEFRGRISEVDILRIDRDGEQSVLIDSDENSSATIIGITFDGADIVYEMRSADRPDRGRVFHYSNERAEHRPIELPEGSDGIQLHHLPAHSGVLGYASGYASSPDGTEMILLLIGDYYLPTDSVLQPDHHPGIYLTTFDNTLQPEIVSVMSSRGLVYPLAWVDNETLAEVVDPATPPPERVTRAEPVEGVRNYVRLDRYSSLSPDRTAVIMAEAVRNTGRPYLWYPEAGTGRWIAQRTSELSWYSDGHGVLGVTDVRSGDDLVSRITQHSAGQRGGSSVDAFFDPAGISDTRGLRYALPRPSTDATRTSFYVINSDRGRAELWIVDWDHGARSIHSTRHSSRVERLSPLSGVWLDEDSFLFTEALDWSNGLPTEVALRRATIEDDGEASIDTLLVHEARGRDYGVALREFAIDPSGDRIAYRVRHYTDRDDTSEAYDSIHVALASNVKQGLEIERGDPSEGMSWSPSGHALAAAIDGRMAIYYADRNRSEFVTGSDLHASFPAWIADDELWFNVGSGGSVDVWHVRLTPDGAD